VHRSQIEYFGARLKNMQDGSRRHAEAQSAGRRPREDRMSPTGLSRQQCEDSRTNEKFILQRKEQACISHHLRMHPLSIYLSS
jgi:hypothetical protein